MNENLLSIPATIQEMAAEPSGFKVDVPFAEGVNIDKLIEGDSDPLFVTVEVANESVSKNNRKYTKELLQEISNQINEKKPNAYLGHLKEEDRDTASPEAQTIWLGSKVVTRNGKAAVIAKGYVLPSANTLRTYLKKAFAVGKKAAVSLYGTASQKWNNATKAYDISNFNLESIDWARHLSEGISGTGLISVASEMTEEGRESLVKSVSISEMVSNNPELVNEIKELGRKELEKEITEVNSRIAEMVVTSELSQVKNPKARVILEQLVLSEMKDKTEQGAIVAVEKVLSSESGKLVVSEMTQSAFAPVVNNRKQTDSHRFIKV